MSVRLTQPPVYAVTCDDGCGAVYTPTTIPPDKRTQARARAEAQRAGWQVRPPLGPGAKSAPDRCPTCRTAGGGR